MNETTETSDELRLALARLARSKDVVAAVQNELRQIHSSDGWKILVRYYELRNRLCPPSSLRRKCLGLLFRSLRAFAKFVIPSADRSVADYHASILAREPGEQELAVQRSMQFAHGFKFSIVSPTYETQPRHLIAMIESVRAQTFANWELCIADGASRSSSVREILAEASRDDPRIKVKFLDQNDGIAGNTARRRRAGQRRFRYVPRSRRHLSAVCTLRSRQGDRSLTSPKPTCSTRTKINSTTAASIVCSPRGSRAGLRELLRNFNYITHLAVYRRELLNEIGGVRFGFDGSQDYDLILRASERARKIVHIPEVLYHWRIHSGSTAQDIGAKPYAIEAGRKALQEHLDRCGIARPGHRSRRSQPAL